VMVCELIALLPQPSVATQVRVIRLVHPMVLVTVVTLGVIGPWHRSLALTPLLKLIGAPHSTVCGPPTPLITGGVVSITVMVWLRLVTLPHPSLAVQVRVITFVQPMVLVTVTNVGVIDPWQASTKLGALKLGALGHSMVVSGPWFTVTTGA